MGNPGREHCPGQVFVFTVVYTLLIERQLLNYNANCQLPPEIVSTRIPFWGSVTTEMSFVHLCFRIIVNSTKFTLNRVASLFNQLLRLIVVLMDRS